ncbi:alpha/beta hydrolase [Tahibacter amnicola]|uniref:Lysophospholipase n=1 Tax=Tahibacter amnicola TaxID=2976241 RepID=A0ABY6BJE5_9GAMM|nr:lysophospholipase [Tahibacter amnicola]UXI70144.1 lysophospholipase [Tahibacter amnicola]
MKRWIGVLAAGLGLFSVAAGAAVTRQVLSLPDVPLRPGVAVTLSATVFQSQPACLPSQTVLALHGLAHTAATYEPLARTVFATPLAARAVCRVVALDLPGHGLSGLPTGLRFGELTLDDYVAALDGALPRLRARGMHVRALVGHSMGGEVIVLAQQALANRGTSLRAAHGVAGVLLLAPALPRPMAWSLADSGAAAQVLGPFIGEDPVLGPVVRIPEPAWTALFFTNASGTVVPGTPANPHQRGYIAAESLFAGAQLTGTAPFVRPSVAAGLFAANRGTALGVVSFSDDVFLPPAEIAALHTHLTASTSGMGHVTVTDPAAVHDMYLSNPSLMVQRAIAAFAALL